MAQYVDALSLYVANTCFNGQNSISSVDLKNTAWQNNSMVNAFRDCGNLTSISNISNTVTDMSGAFAGSGVSSVTIPDSVTDLGSPHTVVTNLYGYDLPDDEWFVNEYGHLYLDTPYVTNSSRMIARNNTTNIISAKFLDIYDVQPINSTCFMVDGYYRAIRNSAMDLVNAKVNDLTVGTFEGCCNIVNTPVIPNQVTNCYRAFYNCNNLKRCTNLSNVNNLDYSFYNCQNLIQVCDIPNSVYSINYAFYNCKSLMSPPNISTAVTDMYYTFVNCSNLRKLPDIPNSVRKMNGIFENCILITEMSNISEGVIEMEFTYQNCTNLITTKPLPESATYLRYTFYSCVNLTQVPSISRNATRLDGVYYNCKNLVTAPVIPNTVYSIYQCFINCYNLTGDILIMCNSLYGADSVHDIFKGTSLTKNVYIPFTYDNGVNSATYNAFINAGYTTDGSVNGVYLKDLDTYMSTHNFTYTTSGTNVTLTNYTGSSNTVTIPYTFKGE